MDKWDTSEAAWRPLSKFEVLLAELIKMLGPQEEKPLSGVNLNFDSAQVSYMGRMFLDFYRRFHTITEEDRTVKFRAYVSEALRLLISDMWSVTGDRQKIESFEFLLGEYLTKIAEEDAIPLPLPKAAQA